MFRFQFIQQLGDLKSQLVHLDQYPQFSFKGIVQDLTWDMVEKNFAQFQSLYPPENSLKKSWTDEEYILLIWTVIKFAQFYNKDINGLDNDDWQRISQILEFKNVESCKFKWLSQKKTNNQDNMWTQQEDQLLYQTIVENGMSFHWNEIAQEMYNCSQGIYFRKGKQYRERWNNYLNPGMKRGIWSEDEDIKLLEISLQVGLRWSLIAKKLLLRTENSVKNRFKSLIKKEKKLRSLSLVAVEPIVVDMKVYEDKQGLDQDLVLILLAIIKRIKNTQSHRPQQYENLNSVLQPPLYANQVKQIDYLSSLQQQLYMNQQIAQQHNYQQSIIQMQQMQQIQQMQQYYLQQQQFSMMNPQGNLQANQQININPPLLNFQETNVKIEPSNPQVDLGKQNSNNLFNNFQLSPISPLSPQFSNFSSQINIDEIKEEEKSDGSSNKEPKLQKLIQVSSESSIQSTKSNFSLEVLRTRLTNLQITDQRVKSRKNMRKSNNSYNSNESESSSPLIPKEIRKVRGGSQGIIDTLGQQNILPQTEHNIKKLSLFFYQQQDKE